MCGIAGFVDFDGHGRDDALRRVRTMTAVIRHRGPDADGFHVDGNVALGHRRLSIIDLAGGHQPMAAADGLVQIVFNGEIYNFRALRSDLEAAGHAFSTSSDTEVILKAYLAWGEGCLERLNGMFAFALWDARSRRLLLARDRVGEKPLYWVGHGRRIAFASEIKALRAAGFCPDEIDPEALDAYFTLGYVPSPKTIYRGVSKLRPGHAMSIGDGGTREWRYWRLEVGTVRRIGVDEAAEELGRLIDASVRERMVSEVPLGAFLSGGLDSSLVVESMARQSGRPVITNTIGFGDPKVSEAGVAEITAARLGTDHHVEYVTPRATDVLPRIAWHFDEPLADSSAIPTWYVCEMARRNVTVALSGDGGDEAFAGYTFRYVPHAFESRIRSAVPATLRSVVFGLAARAWPASKKLPRPLRLKTILGNLAVSDAEAFYRDLAWLQDETRRSVYTPEFMERLRGYSAREAVIPLYRSSNAPDAIGRAQHTDMRLYMTDNVLAKVDRMSMAHSLEVRCPLLDPAILAFGASLPAEVRTSRGVGKLPLRQLAERRLPREVFDMPKRGFSIPAAAWLRQGLRPLVEDLVLRSGSPLHEWMDPGALGVTWSEHLSGARDHNVFFWGAMMLALWHDARRAPFQEVALAA